MVFILYLGFSGFTGLTEDGLSVHSQETSGFRMCLKGKEDQLMCRIPVWE